MSLKMKSLIAEIKPLAQEREKLLLKLQSFVKKEEKKFRILKTAK